MENKFCGERYTSILNVVKDGHVVHVPVCWDYFEERQNYIARDVDSNLEILGKRDFAFVVENNLRLIYRCVKEVNPCGVVLLQRLRNGNYSQYTNDTIARMYAVHSEEFADSLSGTTAILEEMIGLQTLNMLKEQIEKVDGKDPLSEDLKEARVELLRLYPEVQRSEYGLGFFKEGSFWNERQALFEYAIENLGLDREKFEDNLPMALKKLTDNTMDRYLITKDGEKEGEHSAAHVVSTLQTLALMNLLDENKCKSLRAKYDVNEDSLVHSLPHPSVTLLQKK